MKQKYFFQRLIAVCLFAVISIGGCFAQDQLEIKSVFEKYGKKRGATMVVLNKEALQNYKLDAFRSITMKYEIPFSEDVQKALSSDKKSAYKIKEVVSNGVISSGYYQLPLINNRIYRYILFKINNDGKATLIYMEGGKDSESLVNSLFIKKK